MQGREVSRGHEDLRVIAMPGGHVLVGAMVRISRRGNALFTGWLRFGVLVDVTDKLGDVRG